MSGPIARRTTSIVALAVMAALALPAGSALADKDHNNGKGNDDRIHAQKEAQKEAEKQAREDAKRARQCTAAWSLASAGKPAVLRTRGAAGLYLWNDGDSWNVYATHPDRNAAVFQGTITFDAAISVESRHLERRSDVVQSGPNAVAFTFRNYGGVDGVKVRSRCSSTITVTGSLNGQPLAPQQFFVGRSGAAPAALPFTERRAVSTPATTLPPATTAPATTTPACALTPWNVNYGGQPSNLRNGAAAGLYLWVDGDRIRLETTRPNSTPMTVSGSITVNAPVLSVSGRQLDGQDVLSPQPTGATFTFHNTGAIDGLELRSPCATQIVVTATIDGQPVVAQQVWIGRNAFNPPAVPVVLAR